MPLDEIEASVKVMEVRDKNAPLYGLPCNGYCSRLAHIVTAIGVVIAGMSEEDFMLIEQGDPFLQGW